MKTELIKELYKKFRSEYDDDWYSRYKKTVAMVEARRQTLPQNSLSAEGDKELLD